MIIHSGETPFIANQEIDRVPEKYFNEELFVEVWPKLTGTEPLNITDFETSDDKTEAMHRSIVPALDKYIDMFQIPNEMGVNESDDEFFNRVVGTLYGMNQNTPGNFGDCWPTTALELGRLNCSLGSLVVARALERAGYPTDEIEFGWPGPLSHAVIVTKNRYIDQTNGVVVPLSGSLTIDGIKVYRIAGESLDSGEREKVPFRLVPVSSVDKGTVALISNLGPLISDSKNNEQSAQLVNRFNVNPELWYGNLAYDNLLLSNLNQRSMMAQPEWQNEREASSKRIFGE